MKIIKCNGITVYDYASEYLEVLEHISKKEKNNKKTMQMLEVEAMKKSEMQSLRGDIEAMKESELNSLKDDFNRK